jgi:hypothetical protein
MGSVQQEISGVPSTFFSIRVLSLSNLQRVHFVVGGVFLGGAAGARLRDKKQSKKALHTQNLRLTVTGIKPSP